jgi:hypothetical protein
VSELTEDETGKCKGANSGYESMGKWQTGHTIKAAEDFEAGGVIPHQIY